MTKDKLAFQHAFSNLFFLMLVADNVADIKELALGKKIVKYEQLDYVTVMNRVDDLSRVSKKEVFDQSIDLLEALTKKDRLKCLAYMRLIAISDGSYDEREKELLDRISTSTINISVKELNLVEKQLRNYIDEIDIG